MGNNICASGRDENVIIRDDDEPVPQYTRISGVYGVKDTSETAKKQLARYQNIRDKFAKRFGFAPDFFVRAPGRVNIIGEHIDYSGFGVLPMALQNDTVIAVGLNKNEKTKNSITISNVNEAYKEIEVSKNFKKHLSAATVKNREAKSIAFAADEVKLDCHNWESYFLCGYKGALSKIKATPDECKSLNFMVDSNIPIAAGLSSSSALVCAATIATLFGNDAGDKLTMKEIATAALEYEKYIGIEGGGMDQAISMLGEAGYAKKIEFSPEFTATNLRLPEGVVFIVANSLTESRKSEVKDLFFNKRVVEARLACAMLAKRLSAKKSNFKDELTNWERITTLKQLSGAITLTTKEILAEIEKLKKQDGAPYTIAEIEKELGKQIKLNLTGLKQADGVIKAIEDMKADEDAKSRNLDKFQLYNRAKHIITETMRVESFIRLCVNSGDVLDDGQKARLCGDLLNAGMLSASEQYDCSTKELDDLANICTDAGALGARLTGAGWGGCIVAMVKDEDLEKVLKALREKYYASLGALTAKYNSESDYLFQSKPSNGAGVFRLPGASQPEAPEKKAASPADTKPNSATVATPNANTTATPTASPAAATPSAVVVDTPAATPSVASASSSVVTSSVSTSSSSVTVQESAAASSPSSSSAVPLLESAAAVHSAV